MFSIKDIHCNLSSITGDQFCRHGQSCLVSVRNSHSRTLNYTARPFQPDVEVPTNSDDNLSPHVIQLGERFYPRCAALLSTLAAKITDFSSNSTKLLLLLF